MHDILTNPFAVLVEKSTSYCKRHGGGVDGVINRQRRRRTSAQKAHRKRGKASLVGSARSAGASHLFLYCRSNENEAHGSGWSHQTQGVFRPKVMNAM